MEAPALAPRPPHRALYPGRLLTRAALAGALGGLLLAASSPALGGPLFNSDDCATLTPGTTAFFCFDQTSQTLREWDGGRWAILPLVNVRDFGAIGNGTNDDTDAVIQAVTAAAATHSLVIFPATKQSYNLARSFDPKGVTFVLLGASLTGAGAPTANVVTLDKNGNITTGGTLTATTLQGLLTLTTPLGVSSGGTGLSALTSGSFLTGNGTGTVTLLVPPITVANGGTGLATLISHAPLVGEGTSAIASVGPLTNGQILIGSTGADPVAAAITAGTNVTVTSGAGASTVAAVSPVLNFKTDCGGVLDGVTDDTAAFATCVAKLPQPGGGTIFIPRKTLTTATTLLTTGLTITDKKVDILCDGSGGEPNDPANSTNAAVIIKSTSNAAILRYASANQAAEHGRYSVVQGCAIVGSTVAGTSQHGLEVDNMGLTVRDVTISSVGGHGLFLTASVTGLYDNLRIYNSHLDGINIDDSTTAASGGSVNFNTFVNVSSNKNAGDGVNIVHGSGNTFVGLDVEANTGYGMRFQGSGGTRPAQQTKVYASWEEADTAGSAIFTAGSKYNLLDWSYSGTAPNDSGTEDTLWGTDRNTLTLTHRFRRLVVTPTGMGIVAGSSNEFHVGGAMTPVVGPVGNGADVTEDTLGTITLPVNLLTSTGRLVKVTAVGNLAANADSKSIRVKIAGSSVGIVTTTQNNGQWRANLLFWRTGLSTQAGKSFIEVFPTAGGVIAAADARTISTALPETGTIAITITGQDNTAATANSIVLDYAVAEMVDTAGN